MHICADGLGEKADNLPSLKKQETGTVLVQGKPDEQL